MRAPSDFKPRVKRTLLACGLLELAILYAPTMNWLFHRWTMDVWHNAHGMLIPPVVGYFIHRQLQVLKALPTRNSAWGFLIVIPSLAILVLDAAMQTQLLSAISLVLLLPGLSLLLLGPTRTRGILFPMALMTLALPIPLVFTEQIHWQLRLMVTSMTAS